MNKEEAILQQTKLKNLNLYTGIIDGLWGPLSKGAQASYDYVRTVIWSSKVSPEFVLKVRDIVERLGMPLTGVNDLMACMAWESAETFSPSIKNAAGSGAVGLIQFMPKTAVGLGTNSKKLAAMTAIEQLDYVYAYFKPYRGKLKNLGDLYMAILYPIGIGKSDDYVLFKEGRITYRQNAGLDVNRDGGVSRGECIVKVQERYTRGLKFMLV